MVSGQAHISAQEQVAPPGESMKHTLAWEIEQSEKIADCRVFTVHRNSASIVRDGKRRTHDFFYLNSSDWVNVIPITQEGDVILIEQYRAGVAGITLEIPGGTVDAEDLSSKEAGARELLEETGYAADETNIYRANSSKSCHSE